MVLREREAHIEEELYHLIRTILKKHNHEIDGVKFGDIKPQYSVDGGIADLVLPLSDGKLFLVIECKRKVTKPLGLKTVRDFDPLGLNVVNQALNYAVRLGSNTFATTNGERLALFRTPSGEPFRFDTHRLTVIDPFRLDEKNVEEILSFLAKWYAKIPVSLINVDWFFISRLRSFIDFLSKSLKSVIKKLESDEDFSRKFEEFSKRIGGISKEQLAREAAYLLMNKIIFYKILERHYEELPKLKPLSAPDGKYFVEFLKGYFKKAIEITGDFEPIFITELYDDVPLPDLDYVFEEVNSFIEEMDTYKLEEIGSDVVGYIYEELIPDEERHRLGQFYTPPPIAELIVKWAVRSHKDIVLDPAVGSGTFLVKAYQSLMELKSKHYGRTKEKKSPQDIHKEILSQIYADDINPFPAHLTSMNLAMRDVRYPTSEMNVIVEDFFNLRSRLDVFAPYVVRTPKGEIRRHITIPTFDAVVANPPYTRWVEIPEKTQNSINKSIAELLKKYKLSGGIGKETGIYVYFIIHAYDFLKKNGRLGMIISNSWLQSDYGINFANFLLDHFKVKAVIDFNQRLFRIPLIATCVILLEKEENVKIRKENKTVFIYVDEEAKVEEILDAIENPEGWKDKFLINSVKQSDLPRDEKWIRPMFNTAIIEGEIQNSPYICKIGELFDARHGNVTGIFSRGGTGGNAFFYLTKEDSEKWGLEDFVRPLIVSSRYQKFFDFKYEDWKKLKDGGKICFVFMAHKPLVELPENVQKYIEYGENLRTKANKTCDRSISSKTRSESKYFFGWYDLGDIINVKIFVPYYARYKHRFGLIDFPAAFDADFICFIPKSDTILSTEEYKAILAFLNSNFVQLFIETHGRVPGGLGPVSIEEKRANDIPILKIRRLGNEQILKLAEMYDKLELGSRQLGGADLKENIEKLQAHIRAIDEEVIRILGLKQEIGNYTNKLVRILIERRLTRTERARPESVKGEEEPTIKPPKKTTAKKEAEEIHKPLTRWM